MGGRRGVVRLKCYIRETYVSESPHRPYRALDEGRVCNLCATLFGQYACVHERDDYGMSIIHIFVPVDFRVVPWGDIGASENLRYTSLVERLKL